MQSKQKVTLYIPPELHKKLKIKAAIDTESMSALVERAIAFYMRYPDKIEEIEAFSQGKTHQLHFCPECEEPMVMRRGKMMSLNNQDVVSANDDIALKVTGKAESQGESNEELVSCL